MGFTRNCVTALILVLLKKCCCFNFDLNFVDIIDSGNDNSYFGYSVLLQKGITTSSVILVGAPKSNSSYPNHSNIKEPGVLRRCEIGIPNSCKQFVIDSNGNTQYNAGDGRYNYKNRKDGSLLGATVDGGENVGDPFVVCSPRWTNERTDRNGQHYLTNGMCYRVRDSRNLNEVAEKFMPLLDSGKQGYTLDNVMKYYYAIGEVGMSVQYMNKENELLLGAPGVLGWRGTVVRYKDLDSNILPPQQRLVRLRQKRQISSKVTIPNPVHIPSLKEDNSYFGYSISSGKFRSDSPNIWYVTGAPRAEDLQGLVLLYEFSIFNDADLKIHKKLIGDQLGSYFGAAVLGVDTMRNGVADLLIGAPTYFTETWDEGCVYFYKNDGRGNFETVLKIFGDKQAGARFGTTISSLGDINQDSYQDVAIAAPYENEQGVVYIYLGGKNGLSSQFSQKVAAKGIDTSLRGFGFSISKGADIDQNLYNDFAIGAYKSGQVAILKSRPVIKYLATLTPSISELSVDTTSFDVEYCISYTSPTNTVDQVDTNIKIIKDSRTVDNINTAQTVTLTKDRAFCANTSITLRGGNSDYSKPFSIEMSYTISDSQQKEFCSSCPVTDPTESQSVIQNIPFANGCGDDKICQPNIKISATFENNLASLAIGSVTTLKLNVRVDNEGEPAYLCQIHMKLPEDIEISRISSRCELSDDRIYHCLVDNVLQPNTYKELVLDLDVTNLNPQDKELFLNLTADSKGEEINSADNSLPIILPLHLENKMEIGGISSPDQIVYVDEESKIKTEIVNFNHEFSIKNLGPSPLLQIVLNFYFPVELDSLTSKEVALDVSEPEVYVNNQQIKCTTDYPLGFFNNNADKGDGEATDIDEINAGAVISRLRRHSIFAHHSERLTATDAVVDLPINRTVFFNCSNPRVKCMQVTCTSGEMIMKNRDLRATFSIRAHVDVLQQILGNKDIMLISSTAETNVNGKTSQNYVKTLLIGSLTKEKVSYWIYIVCVIVGLIILGIVIFVLYKLNFFNRPVREKLNTESEGSGVKQGIDDDDHDDEDETD